LQSLSFRTQQIFIMHRLEGHSCTQVAAHFGISVSAVEKHIARAVLALMVVAEPQ
jgi:RNA polymerase sigma-70 factor (ECF subfamily)